MITKGIIESIVDKYSIKVRIPTLNGIGKTDLSTAFICTLPNASINFAVGDIVILGFEDNTFSTPIVLGFLYRDAKRQSIFNIECGDIKLLGDLFIDKTGKYLTDELNDIKIKLNTLLDRINSIQTES